MRQPDSLPELRTGFLRMERAYEVQDVFDRVAPYLADSIVTEVEPKRNAFSWREPRGAIGGTQNQWETSIGFESTIINRVFLEQRLGSTYATVVSPDAFVIQQVQDVLKRWLSADPLDFREGPRAFAKALAARQIRYQQELQQDPPRLGVLGIEVDRGPVSLLLESGEFFEDFVSYVDDLILDYPNLENGQVKAFHCAIEDEGIFYECARFDDGTGAIFANDDAAVQRMASALGFLFDFQYAY